MIAEARRISLGLSLVVVLALAVAIAPPLALAGSTGYPCPYADFEADPTTGYAPLEVQFTDLTVINTCELNAFLDLSDLSNALGTNLFYNGVSTWDFGDGSTPFVGSVGDDPTHVYTQPGQYSVTLTVKQKACGFVPDIGSLLRSYPNDAESRESLTLELYITVLARKEYEPPPDPAKMMAANLNVNPTEVVPGQEVVVSANVCNSGGESGVKTATLFVNGIAEQSQTVGVSPGACKALVFRVYKGPPGTYQVNVEGMQGQFTVVAPRIVQRNVPSQQDTGLGTAGIIAIVVVGIVLIIAIAVILKKE